MGQGKQKEIPPLYISFLLFVVSLTLTTTLGIVLFIYGVIKCLFSKNHSLSRLLSQTSISLDQTDNVIAQHALNDFLIKRTLDKELLFGNMDETISSNIGENVNAKNLTKLGIFINGVLDKIDPDHSIEAIEEDEV